nr:unnamed protein product [Callosobruchus analis]
MEGYNAVRCDSSTRHTGGVIIYVRSGLNFFISKTFVCDVYGISQAITKPTRITPDSQSLIDYVLVNKNNVIANVHDSPKVTDHAVISVNFTNEFKSDCNSVKKYRNESGTNRSKEDIFFGTDENASKVLFVGSVSGSGLDINQMKCDRYLKGDTCGRVCCLTNRDILKSSEYNRQFQKQNRFQEMIDTTEVDHRGIVARISIPEDFADKSDTMIRIITKHGVDNLVNYFSKINWADHNLNNLSSDNIAALMLEMYQQAIEESFPLRTVQNENQSIRWFNKELRSLRQQLRKHRKRFNATKATADWLVYNNTKKQYRKTIKVTKRNFYTNSILSSKNICKASWKVINTERKTTSKTAGALSITPEILNNYFATIADSIINTLPIISVDSSHFLNKLPKPCFSFFMPPFTESDVRQALLQLSNSATLDYYGMNSKMLKACIAYITYPLTILYNKCLSEGHWPAAFKISKVTPLHKKGDTKCPGNYRPITIVPVLSKALEILLKGVVTDYFERKGLMTNDQYGFRKNKSTLCALLRIIDDITEGIDEEHSRLATMCDIGKAFDCVPHESLISKLEYYGFRGNELSLFISYLANRTQYVQCGNESSPLLPINHGVPQGSILGPILFIIYINDLPTAVDGTCVLFADDTTILTDNAVDDPCSSAKQWFTANGLMLNAEKTQSILFSSNKKIDKSVPVKLLGVQLDTSLTWLPHVDMLSSRISSKIFVLTVELVFTVLSFKVSILCTHPFSLSLQHNAIGKLFTRNKST